MLCTGLLKLGILFLSFKSWAYCIQKLTLILHLPFLCKTHWHSQQQLWASVVKALKKQDSGPVGPIFPFWCDNQKVALSQWIKHSKILSLVWFGLSLVSAFPCFKFIVKPMQNGARSSRAAALSFPLNTVCSGKSSGLLWGTHHFPWSCSLGTPSSCGWSASCAAQWWFVSVEDGWPWMNF